VIPEIELSRLRWRMERIGFAVHSQSIDDAGVGHLVVDLSRSKSGPRELEVFSQAIGADMQGTSGLRVDVSVTSPEGWGRREKKPDKNDPRKQYLYLDATVQAEVVAEARRIDRSRSWVIQRAWKIAREQIKKMPGFE